MARVTDDVEQCSADKAVGRIPCSGDNDKQEIKPVRTYSRVSQDLPEPALAAHAMAFGNSPDQGTDYMHAFEDAVNSTHEASTSHAEPCDCPSPAGSSTSSHDGIIAGLQSLSFRYQPEDSPTASHQGTQSELLAQSSTFQFEYSYLSEASQGTSASHMPASGNLNTVVAAVLESPQVPCTHGKINTTAAEEEDTIRRHTHGEQHTCTSPTQLQQQVTCSVCFRCGLAVPSSTQQVLHTMQPSQPASCSDSWSATALPQHFTCELCLTAEASHCVESESGSSSSSSWSHVPPFQPTPEDPQLDPDTLHVLLQTLTPKPAGRRFQAQDITDNLRLAEAARQELQHASPTKHGKTTYQTAMHQELQQAVEAIDADVAEESQVNGEVAKLVAERLHDGHRLLSGLVNVLHGLMAAEAAYATAMEGVAQGLLDSSSSSHAASPPRKARAPQGGSSPHTSPARSVVGTGRSGSSGVGPMGPAAAARALLHAPSAPSDHDPVQPLISSLSLLPRTIAQSRRQLQGTMSELARSCQRLLDSFRGACSRVGQEAAAAAARVAAGRAVLAETVSRHWEVCQSFDAILYKRAGGVATHGPETDPWASEAAIVCKHRELQRAQDHERAFLKTAFQQCQSLESQRLQLTKEAVAAVAGSYRAALMPAQHDLAALSQLAGSADTTAKLGFLSSMTTMAGEIADKLAVQEACDMAAKCQELFCSPEVIMQGTLQYLDSPISRWTEATFVLTRAGFLHWFRSGQLMEPAGTLCLSRCQFEAGAAACFHLLRSEPASWRMTGGRRHRYSFQATDAETGRRWSTALQAAIAEAAGGGVECGDVCGAVESALERMWWERAQPSHEEGCTMQPLLHASTLC